MNAARARVDVFPCKRLNLWRLSYLTDTYLDGTAKLNITTNVSEGVCYLNIKFISGAYIFIHMELPGPNVIKLFTLVVCKCS
jgi:hypothetical protein